MSMIDARSRVLVALALVAACGSNESTASVPDAGREAMPEAGGDAPALLTAPVNTVPFTGGVYFAATLETGDMGLQRFWPTRSPSYYTGFQDFAQLFAFRPTDNQLFYSHFAYGIRVDDSATAPDSQVPTPPCVPVDGDPFLSDPIGNFGFDGQGTLYYNCNGVRRGNGDLVNGLSNFFDVLADGRMLMVIEDVSGDPSAVHYGVVGPDGTVLSELRLPSTSYLEPDSDTVQGNDAFVVLSRIAYRADMSTYHAELVCYRLDPQSRWLFVRSVPLDVDGFTSNPLLLADGTILMFGYDDMDPLSALVTAFPPDGTRRVAWRQADSRGIAGFSPALPTLIIGPAEPSGPSVRPE